MVALGEGRLDFPSQCESRTIHSEQPENNPAGWLREPARRGVVRVLVPEVQGSRLLSTVILVAESVKPLNGVPPPA